MRNVFAAALVVTVVFAGAYFYRSAQAICRTPLPYRIGLMDDRFDLSFEQARVAMSDAEAAWEDATGKNLFTYDPNADFAINFVYDERHVLTSARQTLDERLENTEQQTAALERKHEALVAEYEAATAQNKKAIADYEARLRAYEAQVERYNDEGGAPAAAFKDLEKERKALVRLQDDIADAVDNINDIAREIEESAQQAADVLESYNRSVSSFNQTLGDEREFVEGDYRGDHINIYTFSSPEELRLVLVHELGHALSLGHTDEAESIMFPLLGKQDSYTPGAADLALFQNVCGASTLEKVTRQLTGVFTTH